MRRRVTGGSGYDADKIRFRESQGCETQQTQQAKADANELAILANSALYLKVDVCPPDRRRAIDAANPTLPA